MVSYRLIGTGTTNAQGIARCSNNYVGTGKGEVDLVASTDNPIVQGSIQSGTYEVLDNVLYFKGDTVTSNFRSNSNITLSVDDGFVKITPSTNNQWQQFSVGGQNTGWLDPTKDYRVEFDILVPSTVSANPQAYIKGGQPYFSAEWVSRDTWHKIQFKLVNTYNILSRIFDCFDL